MAGPIQKPRVFVVDDEKVIAATIEMILSQSGFIARSFTNPVDALDAALRETPDLLVSDVMMPQMSGVDLAIRLTAQCPDCRVLLFSGQAMTLDLLEAARANGRTFELLSKPVHPHDLLEAIRRNIHPPDATDK